MGWQCENTNESCSRILQRAMQKRVGDGWSEDQMYPQPTTKSRLAETQANSSWLDVVEQEEGEELNLMKWTVQPAQSSAAWTEHISYSLLKQGCRPQSSVIYVPEKCVKYDYMFSHLTKRRQRKLNKKHHAKCIEGKCKVYSVFLSSYHQFAFESMRPSVS